MKDKRPGRVFRLSPMKARTFRLCRLRYRYQYVDSLRPRLRPQDTVGTCVHNVIAALFLLQPEERTEERLLAEFARRWAGLSLRFRRMPGVEELRVRAEELLHQFARGGGLGGQPLLLEPYFQVPIADDVLLTGRPDRVDEDPDGSLHIIDYKTGEPPEEVDALQLRLYAIMVHEALGRPVGRVSFWYLDGGRLWTVSLARQDLLQARQEALALARQMQAEVEFPAHIGPHCAVCPFLYACLHREEIAQRRQAEGW